MIPLAKVKALAQNQVARIAGAIIGALLCLWIARCDGARHQSARDRQDQADAQAKASENASKRDAKVGDSVKAVFADSMKALRVAKAKADSDAAHALTHLGTITIIHHDTPAPQPETPDVAGQSDSTKYATIQRQGDPRLYVVPQFVVDLGAELRRALTEKTDEASKAERNLAIAGAVMHADSNTMRDLRAAADARAKAESIAKSNAGQECRIAFLFPCPPRKIIALGSFAIGAAGGYVLATRK